MTDEYRCKQIHIANAPTLGTHGINKDYFDAQVGSEYSIVKYEFVYDTAIPGSLSNYPLWGHKGQFNSIIAPGDGYLLKAQARFSAAITAGTINFNYRLTRGVNPPALIVPGVDSLQIDLVATNTYGLAKIPAATPEYEVDEDDKWEVVVTTSAGFVVPASQLEFLLYMLVSRNI